MASQGPLYPTTFLDLADESATWANLSFVGANDSAVATCFVASLALGNTARLSGFGFGVSGTVDGVVVEVNRGTFFGSTAVEDLVVRLRKPDGTLSDDKASGGDWPASAATATYGGAADLWGLTVSDAEVNDADFAVEFSIQNNGTAGDDSGRVDYVRVTVHYSTGGGGYADDMMPQTLPPQRANLGRRPRMVGY